MPFGQNQNSPLFNTLMGQSGGGRSLNPLQRAEHNSGYLASGANPNMSKEFSLRELTRFGANRMQPSTINLGGQANDIGLQTLVDLLGAQGQTDPALLNRDVAGISARNQGAQDALQGRLAQANLQRSGVGQMVGGALDQAGLEQIGQRYAQETAQAEERKRSDLMLLLNLVLGPQLQREGISLGVPAGGPSDLESLLGASGGILSGIGSLT